MSKIDLIIIIESCFTFKSISSSNLRRLSSSFLVCSKSALIFSLTALSAAAATAAAAAPDETRGDTNWLWWWWWWWCGCCCCCCCWCWAANRAAALGPSNAWALSNVRCGCCCCCCCRRLFTGEIDIGGVIAFVPSERFVWIGSGLIRFAAKRVYKWEKQFISHFLLYDNYSFTVFNFRRYNNKRNR